MTDTYESQTCQSCGTKFSEYFCTKCKHFTGVEKKPYHCDKCGICRIHKDRSFHCEVCNVCLDKRLQGKHKCRPDSGHDECCICLEVINTRFLQTAVKSYYNREFIQGTEVYVDNDNQCLRRT